MKINDKVTIIDYDECKLYYFNKDINANEFILHCYIYEGVWNCCQQMRKFITIRDEKIYAGIDSFTLHIVDVVSSCDLWVYKKFVRSTDISHLKVGDFIRLKLFKDVEDTLGIGESVWKVLYSKPLKIVDIFTNGKYLVEYCYDDKDMRRYCISAQSIKYICTEEEVDTFIALYGSEKCNKDFIGCCKRIIKINPELKELIESKITTTVIDSKISDIDKIISFSVDESNTKIKLFCEALLRYTNGDEVKKYITDIRSIINEFD